MDAPHVATADADVLEAQYADFLRLYELGLEQREFIGREDLKALELSFARMHSVMDSIRLRQSRLAPAHVLGHEARERREQLCELITEVEALRQRNQETAERLLADARGEMRHLGRGRQAVRGYAKRPVGGARLYDGTR